MAAALPLLFCAPAAAAVPRALRGWAFGFNITNRTLYPEGTANFFPTLNSAADARAVAPALCLGWAYCWDSPWIPHDAGAVTNATAAAAYFEGQASKSTDGSVAAVMPGRGLDECNANNEKYDGERAAAAAGFRRARRAAPSTIIAAWGANAGDTVFASLMRDGTFDLAMVEGYTYCPGCGDWPASGSCCSNAGTEAIDAYFPRLDFAREQGYINRTVFTIGYIVGRSALNPNGWTAEMLRAALTKLKQTYPEMPGVIMYGAAPDRGFANATHGSTPATEAATLSMIRTANELMVELYPDP